MKKPAVMALLGLGLLGAYFFMARKASAATLDEGGVPGGASGAAGAQSFNDIVGGAAPKIIKPGLPTHIAGSPGHPKKPTPIVGGPAKLIPPKAPAPPKSAPAPRIPTTGGRHGGLSGNRRLEVER